MLRLSLLKIVAAVLVVVFPYAVFGAEPSPSAMLYVHGTATLNGTSVPRSSALFPGDLIQTTPDSVANIDAPGSVILVRNESLLQYQGTSVELEHGGVSVSTSQALATRVADLTVSPAAGVWTDFEVKDTNGTVHILAHKGDLIIADASGTSRLAAGQETTRDEPQSKRRKRESGTAPAATGGALNSPIAIGVAVGIAAGVGAWVLVQGDEPVSKD